MSGLHVHRSERADALVEALADVLRTPPPDPFAPEVVAVPARGVERWLTQRLSAHLGQSAAGGDGVCAAIDFTSPARLFADAVAAGSGFDLDDDPWTPGRMAWALLSLIDSCADEPWCPVLSRHLRSEGPSRRMVAATHLARLFTSYGEQRPTLLQEWQAGAATETDTDGAGGALADDLRWQAQLWRRLRAQLTVPSPGERLATACAALTDQPELLELPERLSLFGPTRLTRGQVAVLAALARHRDVHLWLPHPSAALWDRLVPGARQVPRRSADPTACLPRHRLLASLGRDARELQLVLSPVTDTDERHLVGAVPDTLLGRMQHHLHTDTAPPGPPLGADTDERPPLAADDRSVQVHACHGRSRQVEVLREVLLGLLSADPTLEPRDVLVMCPDIESYAPLVSATFGLADSDLPDAHPGHRLRVRLADRSLRQTNPVLAALSRLLDLAGSRVTASQVLDFASLPPVSRRFQLSDSELERLREWVSASGVRWGLDAEFRAPYAMDQVRQNTWQAGLDRILLGVTMAEGEAGWVGLALPLDDVDSTSIDLAGRLAELVDRLGAALDGLSGRQPLDDWLGSLAEALSALTAVSEPDHWQVTQARRELADVAAAAGDQAGSTLLSLGDVRTVLADRLAGRPTRANFRTGNLTMCSMVPMRSVPHRVVCLLGLDDGVFPRTSGVDGDDVLARDPVVGERDRRSEDRQLLLDAVLAAQEHLVVLYTGADERTNTKRPPAVPLGEVLDVIDATVRTEHGDRARDAVVVQHPLQPFDHRNFTAGTLRADGPFSFDRSALAGARAAARERMEDPPFLAAPLPAQEPQPVELDGLIGFLEHPLRGFLRQRLGVLLPDEGEELDDALHAELDGLTKWKVGDRWLRARLAGVDPDTCREAEWRRGALPPGALGTRLLTEVAEKGDKLAEAAAADRQGPARTLDVTVVLAGREIRGSIGSVYAQTLSRVEYGGLKPKHRLRAWAQLLMLSACCPDEPWRATTLGHGKAMLMRSTLVAPPPDRARATLAQLVDLYDRGRREPLPLPLAAAAEYADRRRTGADQAIALQKARAAWEKAFEHEDADAAVVLGTGAPFEVYLQQHPLPEEQEDVFDEPEATRFAALATRLWLPLLDAENLAKP